MHYLQQNFIQRVSNCTFTGAKVMILNRKFLKFEIDLDFVPHRHYNFIERLSYLRNYLINKYLNFNFTKTEDLEMAEVKPQANRLQRFRSTNIIANWAHPPSTL